MFFEPMLAFDHFWPRVEYKLARLQKNEQRNHEHATNSARYSHFSFRHRLLYAKKKGLQMIYVNLLKIKILRIVFLFFIYTEYIKSIASDYRECNNKTAANYCCYTILD